MLREFPKVRQEDNTAGWRRLFQDDRFELFVWYKEDGAIDGFQLCYRERTQQKALTWRDGMGYVHEKVEEGRRSGTPLLKPNGAFPKASLLPALHYSFKPLERPLREFVLNKIEEATV